MTPVTAAAVAYAYISTHILTRRMTRVITDDTSVDHISTHILTRRMTALEQRLTIESVFQLTSSQGGWLTGIIWHVFTRHFNSHPHKEDDINTIGGFSMSELFQLTSSQGGWHAVNTSYNHDLPFQLTSSQGGWRRSKNSQKETAYFNSHPHKEDDFCTLVYDPSLKIISTHILTRRMTSCRRFKRIMKCISTHILTRRMTALHLRCSRSALVFQLTSSQGGWRFSCF